MFGRRWRGEGEGGGGEGGEGGKNCSPIFGRWCLRWTGRIESPSILMFTFTWAVRYHQTVIPDSSILWHLKHSLAAINSTDHTDALVVRKRKKVHHNKAYRGFLQSMQPFTCYHDLTFPAATRNSSAGYHRNVNTNSSFLMDEQRQQKQTGGKCWGLSELNSG